MKGKYLITTDDWFIAPDGKSYNVVWGDVQILTDDTAMGIKTNRGSTNWYAKVGDKENHIIIAGCHIHYAIKCEEEPNTEEVRGWMAENGKFTRYTRPTQIYIV